MLTRRSLTLGRPHVLPGGLVLRRETLEDCVLAEQVLTTARAEADALLARAQDDAERLRDNAWQQACDEVWQQADAVLLQWQQEREQMWASITLTAEALVGTALRQLLAEQPDAARVSALLLQLRLAQPEDEAAVLYCHPDWLEPATQKLQQRQASWSVRADPQLAPQTLCLRTEQGDFRLNWTTLVGAVWPVAPA